MPTTALKPICSALNERLSTLVAVPTGLRSEGYEDERWNDLAVIRLDVRPELRGVINHVEEMFEQENDIMLRLERATGEAIAWDEMGYTEEIGEWGVSHYLIDDARLGNILTAIESIPAASMAL